MSCNDPTQALNGMLLIDPTQAYWSAMGIVDAEFLAAREAQNDDRIEGADAAYDTLEQIKMKLKIPDKPMSDDEQGAEEEPENAEEDDQPVHICARYIEAVQSNYRVDDMRAGLATEGGGGSSWPRRSAWLRCGGARRKTTCMRVPALPWNWVLCTP